MLAQDQVLDVRQEDGIAQHGHVGVEDAHVVLGDLAAEVAGELAQFGFDDLETETEALQLALHLLLGHAPVRDLGQVFAGDARRPHPQTRGDRNAAQDDRLGSLRRGGVDERGRIGSGGFGGGHRTVVGRAGRSCQKLEGERCRVRHRDHPSDPTG